MGSWSNVPGTAIIEMNLKDFDDEIKLAIITEIINMTGDLKIDLDNLWPVELEINFSSGGYYTSGRISGPPEDCYPPDSCDERALNSIILHYGRHEQILNEELADELFDHFYETILDVDLDN